MKKTLLITSLFGILLGAVFSRASWVALLPWGVGGLVVGFVAKDRKTSLISGVLYGFFICISFLIGGYKGETDLHQLFGFGLLVVAVGLVGALCGLLLGFVGNLFSKKKN